MAKPAGVWVVASVSNAQAVITHVIERVLAVPDVERLVLIDDGSVDGSVEQVRAFQDHHRQRGEAVPVTLLVLTRPFGRRAAVLAGLDHARGRCGAAVVMTADLRHPPEVIERMIQCWRDGADLVPAVPEARRPDDGDPEASVALPLLRRLLTVLPVGPLADDPDVVAEAAIERNIRAAVGMIVLETPTAWAQDAAEYIDKGLAVHDRFRGNRLVHATFAPHEPYTVGDNTFERIRMLADELDTHIHMHVHETADEVDSALREHGRRPLRRLDELGLVTSQLAAVHMTQLDDAEIELLAARGASVRTAHGPSESVAGGQSVAAHARRGARAPAAPRRSLPRRDGGAARAEREGAHARGVEAERGREALDRAHRTAQVLGRCERRR